MHFSPKMSAFFLLLRQYPHSAVRLLSWMFLSEERRSSLGLAGEMKDCEEFVFSFQFFRKSSLSMLTLNAVVFSLPHPIVLLREISLGLKSVWFLLGFLWKIPPAFPSKHFYDFGL
jgi:hypothetical protein